MTCLQIKIEFVIVPVSAYCTSVILRIFGDTKYGDSAKRVITISSLRKCQRNVNRLVGYLARDGCKKMQEQPSDAYSTYKYLLVDCGFCSRNKNWRALCKYTVGDSQEETGLCDGKSDVCYESNMW